LHHQIGYHILVASLVMQKMTLTDRAPSQAQNKFGSGFSNGEELLLATSPVFKRRYIHDGDLWLGCRWGCQFCYYRWIAASRDYIGTRKLKRLTTAQGMAEFLQRSKLFLPRDFLILGARGDASMYPKEIIEFLGIISDDEYFKDNIVLALHRPAASPLIIQGLKQYPNFRFGTTITPKSVELGWTRVREKTQLRGLQRLLSAGIDSSKISVEVGPLNSENIEAGIAVLKRLESMGFRDIMVRGMAFGSFGVDREKELDKMIRLGFIKPEMLQTEREDHEYYAVKNFLTEEAYQLLQQEVPGMTVHRHTYTFYRDVWRVPIARNRKNQVRISEPVKHAEKTVKKTIEKYGLTVESIEARNDHYFVELTGNQPATEDIAMSIGAELQEAVIFNNYRRTASISDIQFYRENQLFHLEPYLGGGRR